MPTFVHYRGGKRPHRPRERSKLGCKNCLIKRVKCDEQRPECGRCLRAGVPCPGPRQPDNPTPPLTASESTASSSKAPGSKAPSSDSDQNSNDGEVVQIPKPTKHPSLAMYKTEEEGVTLDRFLKRFVPGMGIFIPTDFFFNVTMPAANMYEEVFNATLAVTTLYDLPLIDIWAEMSPEDKERYGKAIRWYRKSLKQSMESPPDKKSVESVSRFIAAILQYIAIELRQTNWKTQEGLARAAFSIIYSVRHTIKQSKSRFILQALEQLMDLMVQSLNPGCIKKEHYYCAVSCVRALCVACRVSEGLYLSCELWVIMRDVAEILDRGYGSDFELECRMQSWLAHLARWESGLPMDFEARRAPLRLRLTFSHLQIQWEYYLYGQHANQTELHRKLSMALGVLEVNANNTTEDKERPSWFLDTAVIPVCLWVAWYWRSPSILARTKRVFENYRDKSDPEQMRLVQIIGDYIAVLVETPYTQATQIEMEIWGGKPRVLQKYQSYRYVYHIIQKPPEDATRIAFDTGSLQTQPILESYKDAIVVS